MLKEILMVGAAAAIGEYADQKFGASIEAQAVKMKVPPAIAHAAVVGAFAAGGYWVLKSFL